jgi:hypothetical protein
VRHFVPVNRQARAADVRACRESDAVAERQTAKFFLPFGALGDALDALAQSCAADAQTVDGKAVGLHQLLEA